MKKKIMETIQTAWAGRTCLCFDTLESTNDYAKELAGQGSVHGTLVVAESQSAGKGRRGRVWQSPRQGNIYMSLCLEPKLATDHAAGLTLVMALAVTEALRRTTDCDPQIKWPNDVVLNGKKICGILTEMIFQKNGGYAVIIGTGINVNTENIPEELSSSATSLKLETGKETGRGALIGEIMNCFEKFYGQYEETEDLSLLKEQYESRLANKGRQVRVLDPGSPYNGVAKGITPEGNLVVVCGDGTERKVYSGEVSVRGLYGYV